MNEYQIIANYQKLFKNEETQQLLKNPLLQKEVWHTIDDLGLKVLEHRRFYTFNFKNLSPEWLNLLAKLHILIKHKILTSSTLKGHLHTLKKFSEFLNVSSIDNPDQINNQTFEDFNYYLRSQKLSETTIYFHHSNLACFLDTCNLEGWLDINIYWFKGKKYIKKPNNSEINYIPEEVWNQLEENLHYLPEQLQRMVMVIRTTGLRIGELLNLPYDCLRNRNKQWRLRLKETEKYCIEDELPINIPELIIVIQEQQEYITKLFGQKYNQLFCSYNNQSKPVARVMNCNTFNNWLNKLAAQRNICSKSGEQWRFASHQFRRTVATIMTNAGIRDLIIQKYLRHRSPDMLSYYKNIMKQVLKEEYDELIKVHKYVDITGEVVNSHKPTNLITEFLRRKMYQITTQYGECHRPTLKNPCPTVNSCWKCKEWRVSNEDLPYLKEDLQRVEEELHIAEKLGMIRQTQGLESDRQNLQNCIKGLEENNDIY